MTGLDRNDVLQVLSGRFIDFYSQFVSLKMAGGEFRGPCPLHQGQRDSFAVNPDTGLWHCHSECAAGGTVFDFLMQKDGLDFPEALAAIAGWIGASAPVPRASGRLAPPRRIAAAYDYTDEEGRLLFQAVRYDPKGFSQRRPAGNGTWTYSLNGVRRVLYRLPEVIAAIAAGKPVYVCEGEKDADALAALGLCATTAPMGAKKWDKAYTEALCGAGVVILPDNDKDGREHARLVAEALHGRAKRVRVVELPGLPEKGDVSDWRSAGGTKAALLNRVKSAPDWMPTSGKEAHGADAFVPWEASIPFTDAALPAVSTWPSPDPAMFYGLAGDIVRVIEPHTEADPVALLTQLLVAFGSCIGRSAHFRAEADRHYGNLFAVLVGVSSKGRKGTSWGHIRRLMEAADPDWAGQRVASGLSSGEGLIWHVRDPIEKQVKNKKTGEYETEIEDHGIADKRLLVQEGEFAGVLKVMGREGSTLSPLMRNGWDTGSLQSMTKNSPARATGAHVSVVGHVTADELRRELSSTEAGNGFGNRFLWLCVRRSKELPEGGNLAEGALSALTYQMKTVMDAAKQASEMKRDGDARAVWLTVYGELSAAQPGLFGAVTGRGEAQVMRLAMLYALLDGDDAIRRPHMIAALAVWEYVEASARLVFGDNMGDAVADEILRVLRSDAAGRTRDDLRQHFQRNQSSQRIDQALGLLLEHKRIRVVKEQTGGRPAERWFAVEHVSNTDAQKTYGEVTP